jgi:hypothetical protein
MSEWDYGRAEDNTFAEKHYRIGELAKLRALGRETVRKLVKDHPGVGKVRMGRKKAHISYTVPASVARAIHTGPLNGNINPNPTPASRGR